MEKYLFNDGTNVVREVQSKEELESLIKASADPAKVRIWLFDTSEWITLADLGKRSSAFYSPVKKETPLKEAKEETESARIKKGIPSFLKKALAGMILFLVIFLVYNFTRVTWTKASPVSIVAERPANTPEVDADSLIGTIELLRGQKLDKITRTNLRIRNTWPDLLQLQLTADRDTSREGLRYYNLELSVDNSTGYHIDNAVVKFAVWRNGNMNSSDTLKFTDIGYAAPAGRKIEGVYKGDSISVSFSTIRSKAFNFCYSVDKKSNYGNYNDRWFCR
ncbi:MAG: hypothetical protein JNK14_16225 [Chitinophagaceae bacterium]|nr:hypothetical protein [Chitinophagaceae bacterium]